MKRMIWGLFTLCLFLTLTVSALAADPVTVKSYKELVQAVNEDRATEIVISSKYKHGAKTHDYLYLRPGRTVTVRGEAGAAAG